MGFPHDKFCNLTPCPSPPWGGENACTLPFVIKKIFHDTLKYINNGKVLCGGDHSPSWGGEDACTLPFVIRKNFRYTLKYINNGKMLCNGDHSPPQGGEGLGVRLSIFCLLFYTMHKINKILLQIKF